MGAASSGTDHTNHLAVDLLLGDPARSRTAADAIDRRAGWPDVVSLCSDWAALPRLCQRIESLRLSLDTVARDRLKPWANEAFLRSARALSLGARACGALAEAGIDAVAIKGVAASVVLHHGPQRRTIGDADLLVRAADIRRAVSALTRLGLNASTDVAPKGSAHDEERFLNDGNQSMTMVAADGCEVDLHWQIGRIDTDTILSGRQSSVAYGRPVAVVTARHGFLLSAHHLLRNGFELSRSMRDLVDCEGWLAAMTDVDAQVVTSEARAWGLLAPALAATQILARLAPDGAAAKMEVALSADMSPDDQRVAASLTECFFVQCDGVSWNVDLPRTLSAESVFQFLGRTARRTAAYTAHHPQHQKQAQAVPFGRRLWQFGRALPSARWRLVWALKSARDKAFTRPDRAT